PVVLDAVTSSLIPQVVGGLVDFAIVNMPVADPELIVEPLFDEDRVLIAPLDHPLAAYDTVPLAEVARHDLLLPPDGTSFRGELEHDAAALGVELTARAEVDGMRLLASLAFQGFGATIVPSGAVPTYVSGDWKIVWI